MNIKEYVEKTNKKFEESSIEKKRVMIAEDVLKRLEDQNIVACSGKVLGNLYEYPEEQSLKEIINSEITCEVCGKGALLCAFVGRVNEFSVGDIRDEGDIHSISNKYHTKLAEIFPIEQLDLIEIAFEGRSFIESGGLDDLDIERATQFYELYYNEKENLEAIMFNIINNNGTFKP